VIVACFDLHLQQSLAAIELLPKPLLLVQLSLLPVEFLSLTEGVLFIVHLLVIAHYTGVIAQSAAISTVIIALIDLCSSRFLLAVQSLPVTTHCDRYGMKTTIQTICLH